MSIATAAVIPFESRISKSVRRHYQGSDRPSFSVEQLKSFLSVAEQYGVRELAMFVTAFAYGLRVSEISSLKVSDVDFTDKKILITRLKGSNTSRQAFRNVAGYSVETVLRDYLAERAANDAAASDMLFLSQKKSGVDSSTIYRHFVAICEQAGISREFAHPHVMRHSVAQLLHDNGASLEQIQLVLGHRSISSVQVYAKPTMASVDQKVSEVFSRLF